MSEVRSVAPRRVREFFLLEQRLEQARRVGFGPGDPGWPEFVLARSALGDALQLADSFEGERSALLLCRSAVLLLARAERARSTWPHQAPDAVPSALRLLSELPAAQRPLVEAALDATEGEPRLARLSDAERRLALSGLRVLARGLADALEAHVAPLRRVLAARRRRIAVAALVAVSASLWLGVKLFSRTNLARHASVSVSSSWLDLGVSPERLVDGSRTQLGFHSELLPDQSATLDLGRVRRLHSVEVYNRVDCCQARAVPLRLELSSDGVQYHEVERRTKSFTVWKVPVAESARFVRLAHEGQQAFHLAEVEVY